MQTVTERRSVWNSFVIHSPAELRTCLEDYTSRDEQGAPGNGGDEVGELGDWDREGRLMAQNRLIDQGMKELFWSGDDGRLQWKVINLYYRQGLWVERKGWIAPARALGMDVPVCLADRRCRIPGDDRMEIPYCSKGTQCPMYYDRFEEALEGSIHALFAAIQVRCGRKV